MKFVAAILPLIASATASCLYGTSLMPRAADGTVPTITYNYTYTGGPLNWYGLDESKNSACAKGMYQSPIVIYTNEIQYAAAGSVNFSVPVADNAKFENLGFYLEVVLPNGTLSTPLGTYNLVQFHFHVPSEHRINDEHYPMEAHFVFETSNGTVAVMAFLFELSPLGYSTPLFDSVFANLGDITQAGTFTKTGTLDFNGLTKHLNAHGIYQYNGSLTTPPCSENVAWYISTEPVPLNVQSYNAVKHILKFNARYTQNALGQQNLLSLAASELS